MALVWNTRQLLSPTGVETGTADPVEFHFLSRRQLYDSNILTADPLRTVEWAVHGDHHWYTMAVITRPVYEIPQELCLSFDCFWKTKKIGVTQIDGPPIDDVALEFGALLSLLVREPLLPLGTRRMAAGHLNCIVSATSIAHCRHNRFRRRALTRLNCAPFFAGFRMQPRATRTRF